MGDGGGGGPRAAGNRASLPLSVVFPGRGPPARLRLLPGTLGLLDVSELMVGRQKHCPMIAVSGQRNAPVVLRCISLPSCTSIIPLTRTGKHALVQLVEPALDDLVLPRERLYPGDLVVVDVGEGRVRAAQREEKEHGGWAARIQSVLQSLSDSPECTRS